MTPYFGYTTEKKVSAVRPSYGLRSPAPRATISCLEILIHLSIVAIQIHILNMHLFSKTLWGSNHGAESFIYICITVLPTKGEL